ncbi:hypothetical protein [Micromonospora haikouensis]|uniref:hypothetical protein n=1 Tax=Micromonospora haikouensis TaxID=686309 RepID=UPI003D758A69
MNDQQSTGREAVENLTVGQHISDHVGVHQVVHVLRYADANCTPTIALTLLPLGQGDPWVARHREGHKVALADDDEIREFSAAHRRHALAARLRVLATDIVDLRLPVPARRVVLGLWVDDVAEVERWAQHLKAEVRVGTTVPNAPATEADLPLVDDLELNIYVQGPLEPPPADPGAAADAAAILASVLDEDATGGDRRCRNCGATTDVVMRPYGPLDPVEYECIDQAACTPPAEA